MVGFQEGPLSFAPTYKYIKNSDSYDCRSSNASGGTGNISSQKTPSWTDRIFYAGPVELIKYECIPSLRQSDHKPVYAVFNITIKKIDTQKRESLLEILQ